MWILPKNFPISLCATATAGSTSVSTEFSETDYNSPLLARSKPLPWKTLSQKWKQGSFLRLRSGLTYAHSLGKTSWASAWFRAGFPANPFLPPENAEPIPIPDISSPTSSMESDDADLPLFSWRMSKVSSAPNSTETAGATPPERPFCSMSSANWKEWVTERRLEFLARLKSAHRTSGSGSSSWRTPNSQLIEAKPHGTKLFGRTPADPQVGLADQVANWPTVCASEVRQGFQDRSRGKKGSQESLTTVVVKDAAMWPTIRVKQAEDCPSERNRRSPSLDSMAKLHGPAAPASSSTDGSRPELWQTPDVGSTAGGRSARGQSEPHKASLEKQCLWLTPRANEPDSDPNFVARNADRGAHCHGTLSSQAKQWATPRSGKTTDENPETWALRQAKGDVATMPLTAQVKAWATPKASDPQHSGPNMRDSAGNYALPAQVTKQWATPRPPNGGQTTSGAEQKETKKQVLLQHQTGGKLNPRWVETLMGLPVGWTMPSCASPVTIAPTNCDYLGTESSPPPQPARSQPFFPNSAETIDTL